MSVGAHPEPLDRTRIRAVALALCVLAMLAMLAGGCTMLASRALAAEQHTTLPAIEAQVMCATCKVPLIVANSPQADRERAFIQGLIFKGRSEAQIKRALVYQYGPAVLALPSTHGFDIFAYLVPILVVLALLLTLALLLPRWLRRGRTEIVAAPPVPISQSDALRLAEDMDRHP